MTPRQKPVAVLALLLVTTACGPDFGRDVGVKELSTGILDGAQTEDSRPAPTPGAQLNPDFPGFVAPPGAAAAVRLPSSVPGTPTPTPVAAGPCQPAPATEVPATVAEPRVSSLPLPGRYEYRETGTVAVGGGPPEQLASSSVREVRDVSMGLDGSFSYDVVTTRPSAEVTSSYTVRPPPDSVVGVTVTPQAAEASKAKDGLYLTRVVSQNADGTTDEFRPVGAGVRLLTLPVEAGDVWSSVGTDAVHGTTMTIEGVIVGKGVIDACGIVLDSWVVQATGRIIGPSQDLDVGATYNVATQFGTLILAEQVDTSGTTSGESLAIQATATISSAELLVAPR